MPKIMTAALAALFISMSPLAHAQGAAPDRAAELKEFTDARIQIVKVTLGMTPAQEKLWPAVEEAIRARAAARHARLTKLAERMNSDKELNPIEALRARSDALAQRSASLKKLVDAWQPLYESLDQNQKTRLRFVVVMALREMRDGLQQRFWESEDEDDE